MIVPTSGLAVPLNPAFGSDLKA